MRISAVALRALTVMVGLAALALTSEANAAAFARSRFFADFTSPYVHHAQITVTYFFHRAGRRVKPLEVQTAALR